MQGAADGVFGLGRQIGAHPLAFGVHQADLGARVENRHLACEQIRKPAVVGIDAGNQRSPRGADAGVHGCADAAMLLADVMYAGIGLPITAD
jgi:hypothetical protein